jgi:hypothetical protein
VGKNYDYAKVWITEGEVQEMLEGIGVTIETLTGNLSVSTDELVGLLKRSREIAGQILTDVAGLEDEQ